MAVADADSPAIRVYLSDGTADAVGQFDGHSSPVLTLAFNEPAMTVVSADRCDACLFYSCLVLSSALSFGFLSPCHWLLSLVVVVVVVTAVVVYGCWWTFFVVVVLRAVVHF